MINFGNLRLRTKIMAGMCGPLILMLLLGVISIINIKSIIKTGKWVEHTYMALEEAAEINSSAVDMETGMRGFLLAGDETFLEPYIKGEKTTYEKIRSLKETVNDNPDQVERLEKIESILKTWQKDAMDPVIALRREIGITEKNIDFRRKKGFSKTMDDIVDLIKEARGKKYFDNFRTVMAEFRAEEEKLMKKRQTENMSTVSNTITLIIGCIIAAFIFGFIIVFVVTRGITRPIYQTVEVANAIAQGDMTKKLDIRSENEIGKMAAALNQSTDNLSSMLLQIRQNSENLAGASEELSAISSQLANSSEETSAGIGAMASASEQMSISAQNVSSTAEQMTAIMNSIASAVEEMTVSVGDIAGNARQGSDISQKAMDMSDGATKTINALGQAATEIGEVTEVIRQIAQQTNLLALNATIEAASAGDAGKGFAVVANEIKELANQSGKSAEDIAKRIKGVQASTQETILAIKDVSGIISKINESSVSITQSVEQQSATSNEISVNVQQANDGVRNIASSIAEIAKGTNEVAHSAGIAVQNANEISAGSQQVKTSSGDLAKVAAQLQEMAGRFKVET